MFIAKSIVEAHNGRYGLKIIILILIEKKAELPFILLLSTINRQLNVKVIDK